MTPGEHLFAQCHTMCVYIGVPKYLGPCMGRASLWLTCQGGPMSVKWYEHTGGSTCTCTDIRHSHPPFRLQFTHGHWKWHGSFGTYDFLALLHSNYEPWRISYRLRGKGRFWSKKRFFYLVYVTPRSNFVTLFGPEKIEMTPQMVRNVWRVIQPFQRTLEGQTDVRQK